MEDKHSDLQVVPYGNGEGNDDEALPPRISVAKFDYSVENHLKAMDKMLKLSGESEFDFDQSEIQRMSSSVTFLREWRHFCYKPQAIRFACQGETPQSGINLTQFSSASVPKDVSDGKNASSHLSKDFVMYVGGLVWAFDWCPRVHQRLDCDVNLEFIAIAAHPPDSSYHKIGAPLTGRGVIQIWALLNSSSKDDGVISQVKKKSKKNLSHNKATNFEQAQPMKPRGRPRKNPVNILENSSKDTKKPRGRRKKNVDLFTPENISEEDIEIIDRPRSVRIRKKSTKYSADYFDIESEDVLPLSVAFPEVLGRTSLNLPEVFSKTHKRVTKEDSSKKQEGYNKRLKKCKVRSKSPEPSTDLSWQAQKCGTSDHISEDAALPRLVMCLAHNGKVVWDVKWRPLDASVNSKHRMGYLGVLLGNGALEVWEIPIPRVAEAMFSACQKEGTDPRFIKLEPVFRCSMLKCGDRQSIPLTMEWSTSSPHDLILAGCHDGVVALWKFSANGPLKDTRPLLCFNADTIPIRALAWAPVTSDPESANIFVIAGHKGVRFWDIRDPFRPLWDLNHIQRTVYGLDWLPDPRCVVLSFDDGEIRILSLSKAASDVPVTGMPFVGTQFQGLHSYHCSSSSIWSLQVSRLTGMVAYCCSDGTVLQFQLTTKAVEKDPRRNREPHYLCGALTVDGSELTVLSPLPDLPFPMKKSSNEWGDTPRSRRGFLSVSNQEKRSREQMLRCPTPEEQPLAICHNNDPEHIDKLATQKSDQNSKTKNNGNKKPKTDNKTLTNEVSNIDNNIKERIIDEEKEMFPPKILAMHRVRWNTNKGSERWLCYGGAAGIVRCQEISLPKT